MVTVRVIALRFFSLNSNVLRPLFYTKLEKKLNLKEYVSIFFVSLEYFCNFATCLE
ncbi:ABC superfamily ATP binding cassette transporter, membrane protein [Prevotella nigrescens ATCC 33563]|nr:ABC superfamily ATP binding cassette transporter, membrane protein [Prevotella nigrescens ATCC 33563]